VLRLHYHITPAQPTPDAGRLVEGVVESR
jgi:hypothetical protein